MKNMQREGNAIDVANKSGSVMAGGSLLFFDAEGEPFVGVASTTMAPGESGSARVEGVFVLPKGAEAVSQGAALYADMGTGQVSATPGAGKAYAGRAWESALAETAAVACRINFMPPSSGAESGGGGA